jgi:hypothetical protein
MNLAYRLLAGPNGSSYSPSSSSVFGGNSVLASVVSNNQSTLRAQPALLPTPAAVSAVPSAVSTPLSLAATSLGVPFAAAAPAASSEWVDVPIVTQAFGPISTGAGISVKDGMIQVDTAELEGPVNGGSY